jgi:signal transduction histidine kinase
MKPNPSSDISLRPTTILVVDDESSLNLCMRTVLGKSGFRTEPFLTGKAVLDRLTSENIDLLLLLDYSLPDMTGARIVELLDACGLDIPFAMVSADGSEDLVTRMLDLGALDFIIKTPQFIGALPARIRRICDCIEASRRLGGMEDALNRARREKHEMEEQLAHARKMEPLGMLAAGIAHDFNSILGGMIGYAEMLALNLDPGSRLAAYADHIMNSGMRAAELTNRLLSFSRKGGIEKTPVDAHACVRQVCGMLRHSLDKRIDIVCRLRAERSTVMGDMGRLENALLNLAINARDAMPEGETLTFETRNADYPLALRENEGMPTPRGPCIAIAVSDTGTGMDEETRTRIFAPFFTTKKPGKGTGLGLASVCAAVRHLGGHLAVETEHQKGSTFTIYLPLMKEESQHQSAKGRMSSGRPANAESQCQIGMTGRGAILVADDEPVIREITCDMLSSMGYTAHACENGAQAIEYYQQTHSTINAVILDSIMPGMTGLQCLNKLKEINPDIKALIISGHTTPEAETRALEEGAKAFLMKPFKREELREVMEKILK